MQGAGMAASGLFTARRDYSSTAARKGRHDGRPRISLINELGEFPLQRQTPSAGAASAFIPIVALD
jgi:hypothetical protein